MEYTLIGGPNHGNVVEVSNGVQVFEGVYRKAVDGYMVHDSMLYSKHNNWYDLDKHYENNVIPRVENLNENTSIFTVDGVVLSFIQSNTLMMGGGGLILTRTWYNHEYAKYLDVLRD